MGLSPPTRGNPKPAVEYVVGQGSIPAHAGEPLRRKISSSSVTVYPRPGGGTSEGGGVRWRPLGLSPPTRGNRQYRVQASLDNRSIPAHAGEPSWTRLQLSINAVYPRPRGGTVTVGRTRLWSAGLSPPTRGNLLPIRYVDTGTGSIPAHAGEPLVGRWWEAVGMVYPRPRGGTDLKVQVGVGGHGLSPPTRGNLRCLRPQEVAWGSIPAHAGEPIRRGPGDVVAQVYPRPRGGTPRLCLAARSTSGLSPPTRGNPGRGDLPLRSGRSIPAHAGEPSSSSLRTSATRVYPRPRGGTPETRKVRRSLTGLSPPTRGNLGDRCHAQRRHRSIPAHAGEPWTRSWRR